MESPLILDHLLRQMEMLQRELGAFQKEENLWQVVPGVHNASGNLCLHICGNLQHFIGQVLGNTGYIRNREQEFGSAGLSREALLAEVNSTIACLREVLPAVEPAVWLKEYPIQVLAEPMRTDAFILHLGGHAAYHIGQINYLRRILEG